VGGRGGGGGGEEGPRGFSIGGGGASGAVGPAPSGSARGGGGASRSGGPFWSPVRAGAQRSKAARASSSAGSQQDAASGMSAIPLTTRGASPPSRHAATSSTKGDTTVGLPRWSLAGHESTSSRSGMERA